MARQNINIGVTSNDGTGDPLRDAMDKVNGNFIELYANVANMFDGSYTSLSGKPTIPATLLDLSITEGTAGQVLSTDGAGTFTFVDASASNDAAVDTHLNTSTASNNEVLSWNGSDYAWVAQSGGGSTYTDSDAVDAIQAVNLDMGTNDITTTGKVYFANVFPDTNSLPSAATYHGMFAHVHATGAAYFAHGGAWVQLANNSDLGGGGGGGSSLQTRSSATGTSSSLNNDASANIEITGFKGYALLKIETDRAAWVRIYTDAAARTADVSRVETSDPTPDSGVIAEVITTGAETVVISPGTIGFSNESTPDTTIPVRVTNKSGSASTVQVTLTVLQLEA